MANQLFLEDLKEMTNEEVRNHLIEEYDAAPEKLDKLNVLIAYESVGSWGCDSNSFFLLQDKETDKLYGVYGSHCSCYGFENQFDLEEHSVEYLKSEHFSFYCGGYDKDSTGNTEAVTNYINTNL